MYPDGHGDFDHFGCTGRCLPVMRRCSTHYLAAILQECSSAGVRVWVCTSPDAHRVSHVSRWAEVPRLPLVVLNTIAIPVDVCQCCAAVPHTTYTSRDTTLIRQLSGVGL